MLRSLSALPRRTSSCQKVLPPSIITSSDCISFDKVSIVVSVIFPAGSITQAVRGLSSLRTKSSSVPAQRAPAALGEHVEIAARLRRLDDAKARLLAWHRQILGIIRSDLQEHAAVGAAFVGLPGRMQEARAEFGAGRDVTLVAHQKPHL